VSLRGWPSRAASANLGSISLRDWKVVLSKQRLRVVILYTHPLLGEGLASLLAFEQGIAVTCAPAHDLESVMQALKVRPDAVIFEWNDVLCEIDLPRAVPDALLIDASMDDARGAVVVADACGDDDVLATLRNMRSAARRTITKSPLRAPTASSPT
jgi:DNA-binding NarL/FixJ family response regulator